MADGSYQVSCPCPTHKLGDKKLRCRVADGDKPGVVLVNCFLCERVDILAALRDKGLLHNEAPREPRPQPLPSRPITVEENPEAVELWKAAKPAEETVVEAYLRKRGIGIHIPPSIRFTSWPYQGVEYPAMLVAMKSERKIVSVQATLLSPDGTKASVPYPRQNLAGARMFDGAIQLDRLPAKSKVLGLAEGTENALSAIELSGLSVWATGGSGRTGKIKLPDQVREVIIFADNDKAGRDAVEQAKAAYSDLTVSARFPSHGGDWNDELLAQKRAGVLAHG